MEKLNGEGQAHEETNTSERGETGDSTRHPAEKKGTGLRSKDGMAGRMEERTATLGKKSEANQGKEGTKHKRTAHHRRKTETSGKEHRWRRNTRHRSAGRTEAQTEKNNAGEGGGPQSKARTRTTARKKAGGTRRAGTEPDRRRSESGKKEGKKKNTPAKGVKARGKRQGKQFECGTKKRRGTKAETEGDGRNGKPIDGGDSKSDRARRECQSRQTTDARAGTRSVTTCERKETMLSDKGQERRLQWQGRSKAKKDYRGPESQMQ